MYDLVIYSVELYFCFQFYLKIEMYSMCWNISILLFSGGDKATQLSRSCIIPSIPTDMDTLVSSYDEKTSAIKLFSVDKVKNIYNFHVEENILDLCPLSGIEMNSSRSLAALSGTSLSIFSVWMQQTITIIYGFIYYRSS